MVMMIQDKYPMVPKMLLRKPLNLSFSESSSVEESEVTSEVATLFAAVAFSPSK